MTLIGLEAVFAGYGEAEILHGVDFALGEREVVTIIGPNGAGKSTLLKVVMGYVVPRTGTVRLRGRDVTGEGPERRIRDGVAFVPQLDNVFASLTIAENLAMGGYLLTRPALSARLDSIYTEFPMLAECRDRPARTLSGGQRQILAMARATMTDPEILILDEPSAMLSPRMADEVFRKIAEIADTGRAILIVEQEARRSLEISDRGLVLVEGRTAFAGPAAAILGDETIRTAFLGPAPDGTDKPPAPIR